MAAALESLLQCAICMDTLNKPKMLHCAHSFCRDCLMRIPKENNTIRCPSCRKDTRLSRNGVDGLTDDFRMVQLKESLQTMVPQSQASKATATDCDVCSKSAATTCCLQCHKKMCPICLRRHNTHHNSAMHTIFRTEDLQICNKHGDYCGHVCSSCRRFVCVTCLMDSCSSHECRDVGEFARACLQQDNTNLLHMLGRVYYQVGREQTEQFTVVHRQIEQQYDAMVSSLQQKRDELVQQLQTLKAANRQKVEALEKEDVTSAQGLLAAYNGGDAMGPGGQLSLLEGIPSTLLKLLPTLQAGSLPPGSLEPAPKFTPNGFDIGELVAQSNRPGTSAGTSAGAPPPVPGTVSATPAAAGTNTPPTAPQAPAAAAAAAAAPAAQAATADNRPQLEYPQDIQFSKIVRDIRRNNDGIIARYLSYIVRLEFLAGTQILIQIYEHDTHRGYFEESDLLDRFRDVQTMGDYNREIEFMKGKLFNFINEQNHPFQFEKIVHDRRRFMNALVAKAGNLIIRHDFNAQNAVDAVFHPGDPSYSEEEALINRFPRIDPGNFQDQVTLMAEHMQQYEDAHQMEDDAASVGSTGELFDGRQAPVASYGFREDIYGSEFRDEPSGSASPTSERSMSPAQGYYWPQVYHNLRQQGYPESSSSDSDY